MPQFERPREKFLTSEIDAMSTEDLLAIILQNGTHGTSAKTLANEILKLVHSLGSYDELTLTKLKSIRGIGEVKAMMVLASLELGRRMQEKIPQITNLVFQNSKIVYQYYAPKLGEKKQEYFYCLYLDNKKRILKEKLLFMGTINYSTVHPREIFKEAYLVSASSIICIHNHPSGVANPSDADIHLTQQLIEIGKLLGIPLVDHIIITRNRYYSFFENNMI